MTTSSVTTGSNSIQDPLSTAASNAAQNPIATTGLGPVISSDSLQSIYQQEPGASQDLKDYEKNINDRNQDLHNGHYQDATAKQLAAQQVYAKLRPEEQVEAFTFDGALENRDTPADDTNFSDASHAQTSLGLQQAMSVAAQEPGAQTTSFGRIYTADGLNQIQTSENGSPDASALAAYQQDISNRNDTIQKAEQASSSDRQNYLDQAAQEQIDALKQFNGLSDSGKDLASLYDRISGNVKTPATNYTENDPSKLESLFLGFDPDANT